MIKTENLPSKGPIGTPGQRKSKSTKDGEGAETEDYLPLIMIAVSFEEQPYSTTYDWYDIIFDQKYSLKQYYKDMSFDKFTFMPVQDSLAELIGSVKKDQSGPYTKETLENLKKAVNNANAIYDDDTATLEEIKEIRTELAMAWRLLEVTDEPDQTDPAAQAWREAVCNLARALSDAYATVNEDDYKPAEYASFMKVCDDAYLLLENPDSTTEELEDALVKVVTARTSLDKNGRKIQIKKASNPLKVKGKKVKVSYKKLRKKTCRLSVGKVITFTRKGKGKMSYKLAGVVKPKYKEYFKVNAKSGKVTIKKGLGKGSYIIKIKAKAQGDSNYKASPEKVIKTKIIVK